MKNAKQKLALLRSALQARGWVEESPFGLPLAYFRPSMVTPYFHCYDIRSMRGEPRLLRVCGGVGVIHRAFEDQWLQSHPEVAHEPFNPFPLHLLIDNFLELETDVAMLASRLDSEVASFADAITRFLLGCMPQHEEGLAAAFAAGKLCGKSLSSFQSADELTTAKCNDLRGYLEGAMHTR